MEALDQRTDSTMCKRILIVDDEESIRSTLDAVLSDEGYEVVCASSGEEALGMLEQVAPALVLLDIWMPGLDGMETLERMLEVAPDLPVIMISGHATIATAVQATRKGAADFIEKPLDLDSTLRSIHFVLDSHADYEKDSNSKGDPTTTSPVRDMQLEVGDDTKCHINSEVFNWTAWKGAAVPQKTIKQSCVIYGHGVHTGQKSGLKLEPLPENSGIHFIGMSSTCAAPAHVASVSSTGWATTLQSKDTKVSTVEHLMSALHAYGITNLLIKCNEEVPVMDGSAREFCNLLDEVGVRNQNAEIRALKIPEVIEVHGKGSEFLRLEPSDQFQVDYELIYPEPVGTQNFSFVLSKDSFVKEIASCRTFGFVKDIGSLQQQGLAQGGRFDNFVLIGQEGAINGDLRFPDEAVRHKILDIVGDLYLLGRPLQAK
ncbi:MAG: UDP-3-O-[3-hydroxymyristoyl] N-acetylglucosamine deacetylase, partial [Bdellovibrionales bacterium]|nr:UDP-3-O-[3-hydroxymyristoyl] N-acetylglucosamine deacetylase [Bdellovibrionales bacterium]